LLPAYVCWQTAALDDDPTAGETAICSARTRRAFASARKGDCNGDTSYGRSNWPQHFAH
jgi:hypothetical protein